ncbi:sensor histidine kinase [Bacillus sp. A301a_S52]|nr:sensor histidine kinase [Bacillus sp. A301a_S52]
MIRIRTKLLIYFATILLLMMTLFYFREQSNQQVTNFNSENIEHFFLLNEITKSTNQTFQALQIYAHEPLLDNHSTYEEERDYLEQLQQEFASNEAVDIPAKNFLNLMTTFLEQTQQTVDGIQNQDIPHYSLYLVESETTAGYIHEKIRDLINMELTTYQDLSILMDLKVENTKKMSNAIIIAVILLSILFAIWFSHGITKTINQLTWAAKEISKGKYSVQDLVVPRKDELYFLTETFNHMKQNIIESMKQMEEKSRLAHLLKEMELRSLQNQINPHFLFNTLNTISKTAYIEGAERTSDLITSVSALLRYNIGNLDRDTTLKDEVAIVNEYFFIQNTRFGGRVELTQHIDPTCLSQPIPCLTLQPIVENAFVHGIENIAKGAKITLDIYKKGESIYLEVADNGVGMDQQTIEHLLGSKDKKVTSPTKKGSGHSTGIGLINVIDRLRLFNKHSKVSIDSALGKGTRIRIQLQK